MENVQKKGVTVVSGKDMVIPEDASRYFGLYHLTEEGPHNLAMPLWHWGKFYEQLIRTIMDGTWKYDDNYEQKRSTTGGGLSAGVVDVIHSQNLPIGTRRLIRLLKTYHKGRIQSVLGSSVLSGWNGTVRSEQGSFSGRDHHHGLAGRKRCRLDPDTQRINRSGQTGYTAVWS